MSVNGSRCLLGNVREAGVCLAVIVRCEEAFGGAVGGRTEGCRAGNGGPLSAGVEFGQEGNQQAIADAFSFDGVGAGALIG